MPLPSLSPEQRAAALEKAAAARKARAELKEKLKRGEMTFGDVLTRAEKDEVIGKLKVSSVLEALPGIGKVRAAQIMDRLHIAESRRLRGLGEHQRRLLLTEFGNSR
ncbi:MAG TPA: integration host factor, actinobacterial type [Micromonosporaceae bacterium]